MLTCTNEEVINSAPTEGLGYEFNTNVETHQAISSWTHEKSAALSRCDYVQTWCADKITSMDGLFMENKRLIKMYRRGIRPLLQACVGCFRIPLNSIPMSLIGT